MGHQKVSDIVLEFCSETSFHAIKFFTKEGFSAIKRVFWILCWIASLTACIYCIAINVTEYQTTSTITTIDSTTYPVKRLSFPSATFCNFNYIMQSRNPPRQEEVLGSCPAISTSPSSNFCLIEEQILQVSHIKVELLNELQKLKRSSCSNFGLLLRCINEFSKPPSFHLELVLVDVIRCIAQAAIFFYCGDTPVEANSPSPLMVKREFPDSQWTEIVGAIYENLFGDEPAAINITLGSKDVTCIIKQGAQKCKEMVLFCLWQGIHDCRQLFHLVPTKFGFCCVFDPLPERKNLNASYGCPGETKSSVEQNQANKSRQAQLSVSALTDGLKRGLTVVLDAQTEDYSYSTFHSTGFQLHLQEPGQPGLSEDTIVLTPGRESFVSLSAHSTFTTPAALALRPQDRRQVRAILGVQTSFNIQFTLPRKCYRSSENNGHYTHNGCILQHQTAYILGECGCKDFHSPGPGDVCYRQEQISCMTSSRDKWDTDTTQQNLLDCVCLPRCNKTWYVATPSYADFPNRNLMKSWLGIRFLLPLMGKLCREGRIQLHFGQERSQSNRTELTKETVDRICMITDTEELEKALTDFPDLLKFLLTYIEDNVSVGHLFFGHSVSTLYKRDVVTTPSQIVANIGGLLGLFLGFSLLSGAEIVFCLFEIISSLGSSVFKKASVVHVDGTSSQKS
ncbi:acid-sensing ion channel 3-like [Macrobrachium rosenbergii]|uniref:acid-sensing ion channel 3-like n=1 Tax=Macrobrachium rosenbergii TaxID=79674 RepID=UPI0034D5AA29